MQRHFTVSPREMNVVMTFKHRQHPMFREVHVVNNFCNWTTVHVPYWNGTVGQSYSKVTGV
jgi:hypothetical protein